MEKTESFAQNGGNYDGVLNGERVEIIPPRLNWDALHEAFRAIQRGDVTPGRLLTDMWEESAHPQEVYGVAHDGSTMERLAEGTMSATNKSNDRYIWHETIQTQHTRRSFLSEVAPDVIVTVQKWLSSNRFILPDGYECVIVNRSSHCVEAEIYTAAGVRLIRIGVADHARCGASLWDRIGGDPATKPREPWCGVSLDPVGSVADPEAYGWLGDFERCLAWAWLESDRKETYA